MTKYLTQLKSHYEIARYGNAGVVQDVQTFRQLPAALRAYARMVNDMQAQHAGHPKAQSPEIVAALLAEFTANAPADPKHKRNGVIYMSVAEDSPPRVVFETLFGRS